ncbi:hypothetical protein ACHAWF_010538 [Thalassiosira exigua]
MGSCEPDSNGTALVYTPPPNGTITGNVTCEYEACTTDRLSCDSANVTITIEDEVGPVVDAANDQATAITQSSLGIAAASSSRVEVLENDSTDPEGLGLFVANVTQQAAPGTGSFVVSDDAKALVYTPPSDFAGEAWAEYEACTEDRTSCDRANVTISVLPAVAAVDDVATVSSGSENNTVKVLENDSTSPSGYNLVVEDITIDPVDGTGTCSLSADKKAVVYTPPTSAFEGQATCEYEACTDDGQSCDKANVTITVVPSVVATDDNIAVNSSSTKHRVEVLKNDFTNPLGHDLIVRNITIEPANGTGTFVISTDKKTLSYSLPSDPTFAGEAKCEYEACTTNELSCDRANATVSSSPSKAPTSKPTDAPSHRPTDSPSSAPTGSPSKAPTSKPTDAPSHHPTDSPSKAPTDSPSKAPTSKPTDSPSNAPTNSPSKAPTAKPTDAPSTPPTDMPSKAPTSSPSKAPTAKPTDAPSTPPTNTPSNAPTGSPSKNPTSPPTTPPPV